MSVCSDSKWLWLAMTVSLVLGACGDEGDDDIDNEADAGSADAAVDSGSATDSGTIDSGPPPPDCTADCEIVQIAAGTHHTCGRRASGQVVCWGGNEHGQIGDNSVRHDDCTPQESATFVDCAAAPQTVANITDAVDIRANGGTNTMARTDDGQVFFWGLEDVPVVGSDAREEHYEPTELEEFLGATWIANNGRHACAVIGADGGNTLWCRGNNTSGQVGVAATTDKVRTAAMISVDGVTYAAVGNSGAHSTCVVAGGEVYCWGDNQLGQVGDGMTHDTCGSLPSTYDCTSTPSLVSSISGIEEVSIGQQHVCALSSGGQVYCWGDNTTYQLGDPDSTGSRNTPYLVSSLSNTAQLALGSFFTCALDNDGVVRCFGFNSQGQLGDSLDSHGMTCALGSITKDCTATPVTVVLPDAAIAITAGQTHACALLENNDVYCWGYNDQRQLGDGTRESTSTPVRVQGLE